MTIIVETVDGPVEAPPPPPSGNLVIDGEYVPHPTVSFIAITEDNVGQYSAYGRFLVDNTDCTDDRIEIGRTSRVRVDHQEHVASVSLSDSCGGVVALRDRLDDYSVFDWTVAGSTEGPSERAAATILSRTFDFEQE